MLRRRLRRSLPLALTAILLPGLVLAADPAPTFYAVISDTQKPDHDPLTDFRWAVGQLNLLKPPLLVMPGDLTNTGTERQYTAAVQVARSCVAPVWFVIGNHDAVPGEQVYRERFTHFCGQAPWRHERLGAWHFFLLDSARFIDGRLQHDGQVSQEQLDWLAGELKDVGPEEPCVLVAHHPFAIQADGLVNADAVLDLFDGHYLVYTLAGHFHGNRHDVDHRAIHHLVTASLSFGLPKATGIGYRLISTAGRDFWTTWVPTATEQPFRQVFAAAPGAITVPTRLTVPGSGERACLRLDYAGGAVTVSVAGTQVAELAAAEQATAFLPLAGAAAEALVKGPATIELAPGAKTVVSTVSVWSSPTPWDHYLLRRPGETRAELTLHAPVDGARVERAVVPILAVGRAAGAAQPALSIDGREVAPNDGRMVALIVKVNGVQSKSYGFINNLYVNGEVFRRLPWDRDITDWEELAYAVPRAVWDRQSPATVALTAGTKDDGSGANPPANNEDYWAQGVLAYDRGRFLDDPDSPADKGFLLGDNSARPRCRLDMTPRRDVKPGPLRVLLHAWDTTNLAAGKHTVTVALGGVSRTITVEVP